MSDLTPEPDTDVTPEPDTKDWTWVLTSPCPECGLDAGSVAPAEIGALVRSWTPRWQAVLARPDVAVRPRPGVWSSLEYACHVRDVHRVFATRLRLMVEEDAPTFADWDQDAAAVEGRYREQDPFTVGAELAQAAEVAAARFDAVEGATWQRTGVRSNGSRFTVATLGQYYVHDVVHHLHDVGA